MEQVVLEWVSTKDKLPDMENVFGSGYILFCAEGCVMYGDFNHMRRFEEYSNDGWGGTEYEIDKVSHWLKIEPPNNV